MSSSSSPSPTTVSASMTNLFPTATQSDSNSDSVHGTNVYYLVFLGVVVVLLALAACLAVRAIRQRRRYRTATQMAIARGGQLPDDPNDYWGLSGLSGWTPEGLDRFGLPLPSGDRNGGRGRWQQIPVIWDGIADEKLKGEEETDGWGFAQPVTLHSLRPFDQPTPNVASSSPDTTSHSRPIPRLALSARALAHRRRGLDSVDGAVPAESPIKQTELSRDLAPGEQLRIAVVIRMPAEEEMDPQRPQGGAEDEDEDRSGWEPGMELGVWEGVIRGGDVWG